ncbi:hypothetical protein FIV42_24090 [Persicimonas caeni]|uniref:DUF7151 domain-containing protein n=1 Tax=Persicimonas caeni TaxID=2292766 RepID=A0A4Y6PZL6_PERCE|nr:hypothetical protein FIV42_24090 [Persicimonas caeni]QED34933.1 hypothetical protein FRD00_24085 [Persicimonas caeni]
MTDVVIQGNAAPRGAGGRPYYSGSNGQPGKGWGGGLFTNGGSIAVFGTSIISDNNDEGVDATQADCGTTGGGTITADTTVYFPAATGCPTTTATVEMPYRTQVTSLPVGDANCADGGVQIDTGFDDGTSTGIRANGILEADEIDSTEYVCNGAPGADGTDGATALVNLTTLNVGDANCANGGVQLDVGLDNGDGGETAGDGTLGAGEVDSTNYACNGTNGQDGADGADGTNGHNSLSRYTALPIGDANCANGGQMLEAGLDNADGGGTADDGVLDAGEVDSTSYICNGADGADGANGADGADGTNGYSSLVTTTGLAVGDANCANGGVQFDAGLDNGDGGEAAADGVLDAGEVDSTSYICNGADGADGSDSLTLTTPLATGDANCADGGTQIDFGLDNGDGGETAGDGVLDAGEVDSTTYVCNGAAGQDGSSQLSATSDLAVGDANCPDGGTQIDFGLDNGDGGETAGDGVLDAGEVDSTAYLCNGADGEDGTETLVEVTEEPAGDNCEAGGQRIDAGSDLDADGTLGDDEITTTTYVCNGIDGQDGADGTDGADGENGADGADAASLLTRVRPLTGDEDECSATGFMLEVGRDVDGDGELSEEEVESSSAVCHGTRGPAGPEGGCSSTGNGHAPGSFAAVLLLALGALVRRRRS